MRCVQLDTTIAATMAKNVIFFIVKIGFCLSRKLENKNRNLKTVKTFFLTDLQTTLQKEIYLLETKQIRNAALHLKGNRTQIELNLQNKTDNWVSTRLQKAKSEILRNMEVQFI